MNILFEEVPQGVDIAQVTQAMTLVKGVTSVHDSHLWALTSGKASLTALVVYEPGALPEELLAPLKEILAERF